MKATASAAHDPERAEMTEMHYDDWGAELDESDDEELVIDEALIDALRARIVELATSSELRAMLRAEPD